MIPVRKVIASLLLVSALPGAVPVAQAPRKAPELVIRNQNNAQTLLSSYRGKTVVLAFMYTTCPHCQKMAGILTDVQKEYASKGVQVLGAVFDQDAKNRYVVFQMMFAKGFPLGYVLNADVLSFLKQPEKNPPFVPVVVFIDKNGMIRKTHMITADTPSSDVEEHKFFDKPEIAIRAEIDALLKPAAKPAR